MKPRAIKMVIIIERFPRRQTPDSPPTITVWIIRQKDFCARKFHPTLPVHTVAHGAGALPGLEVSLQRALGTESAEETRARLLHQLEDTGRQIAACKKKRKLINTRGM